MKRLKIITTAVTVMLLATGLWAQEHQHGGTTDMQKKTDKEMRGGKMAPACKAMMADRERIMKETQALDARLDAKFRALKEAREDQRIDALTDVVEELVAQRKAMRGMAMGGMMGMMGHMMEHMKSGMMSGGMAMAECPMMKGMMAPGEGADKADPGDHSAHH